MTCRSGITNRFSLTIPDIKKFCGGFLKDIKERRNPVIVSEGLAQFLDWVRETEELYRIGTANEEEANQETQDILHSLELEEHSYHENARLGKKLGEIRKKRRAGKDLVDQTSSICGWTETHRQTLKELEQLLGIVRKAERKCEGRIYTPRTEATKI